MDGFDNLAVVGHRLFSSDSTKNGKLFLAVKYHGLNPQTKSDKFSLPFMDVRIAKVNYARVFSCLEERLFTRSV